MKSLKKQGEMRRWVTLLTVSILSLSFTGCDSDSITNPPDSPFISASDWVSNVDWDAKTIVEVRMVENGAELSYSLSQMTFEAGKPYVLRISNPAGNQGKHYFSPAQAKDFFQSIATRKVQTADAEYKAPFFKAVELLIGGELDIYFVPVIPGTYDFLCTITGHADRGMKGQITVTGGEGYELDLEVSSNFNSALSSDPRTSGSHSVWSTATEPVVSMVENSDGSLSFDPETLILTKDKGYKLNLVNTGSNGSKHYYTASEFYQTLVTRKAEDSQAEIKVPYFKAVELLVGGTSELFIVPTVSGQYAVICTISGHQEAGMHGHISVQ